MQRAASNLAVLRYRCSGFAMLPSSWGRGGFRKQGRYVAPLPKMHHIAIVDTVSVVWSDEGRARNSAPVPVGSVVFLATDRFAGTILPFFNTRPFNGGQARAICAAAGLIG